MKRLFVVLLVLVTWNVSGCHDAAVGLPEMLRGTYTLRSIGGKRVPYSYPWPGGGREMRIRGGRLTLRSDRTYSFVIEHQMIDASGTTSGRTTETGTWVAFSAVDFELHRENMPSMAGVRTSWRTLMIGGDAWTPVHEFTR